jgi:hypothetical protein
LSYQPWRRPRRFQSITPLLLKQRDVFEQISLKRLVALEAKPLKLRECSMRRTQTEDDLSFRIPDNFGTRPIGGLSFCVAGQMQHRPDCAGSRGSRDHDFYLSDQRSKLYEPVAIRSNLVIPHQVVVQCCFRAGAGPVDNSLKRLSSGDTT